MGDYSTFRICAINGSPRVNGQTSKRLQKILGDAKKLGAKGTIVHLIREKLAFCDGDEEPRKTGADLARVLGRIQAADAIVFGTPTYWFNMSGLMKNFLDRLIVTERTWSLEGKVAGFVACGAKHEDGSINAISGIATATNHLGMVTFPYSMLYFRGSGADWAKSYMREYAERMLEMVRVTRELRVREK